MRVTIKKIAELANVSRGTVDRVLNNRPGVRDEVRKRVKEIAEALNYKPNMLGKALVNLNKEMSIGVLLAPDYNPFVDEIKRGIKSAYQEIKDFGVKIDVEVIRTLDANEQLTILNKMENENISAVALVPIDQGVIREKIDSLVENGIPVVTFNSDINDTRRLCFVGQDHIKGGRAAAGLMGKLLNGEGRIAVITSSHNLLCHQQRMEGFKRKLEEKYKNIEIVRIEENEDRDDKAFEITLTYCNKISDLKGIYITGGGVSGLGKGLKVAGKSGLVRVVCHDFVPGTVELLKEGIIDFAIGQDPYHQGYLPVKILFEYLLTDKRPDEEFIETNVDIRTEDNIDLIS